MLLKQKETPEHENFAPLDLVSEEGCRFCDPIKVPGVPGVFERAVILQKIKGKKFTPRSADYVKFLPLCFDLLFFLCSDGEKIPNCTEEVLRETSLSRATNIEKLLLSIHPSIKSYHLWICHDSVTGQKYVCLK